jgi:hypothetical protein
MARRAVLLTADREEHARNVTPGDCTVVATMPLCNPVVAVRWREDAMRTRWAAGVVTVGVVLAASRRSATAQWVSC